VRFLLRSHLRNLLELPPPSHRFSLLDFQVVNRVGNHLLNHLPNLQHIPRRNLLVLHLCNHLLNLPMFPAIVPVRSHPLCPR